MDHGKPRGSVERKETQPPSDGPGVVDFTKIPSSHVWDDLPKHLKIKKKFTYIRKHGDRKLTSRRKMVSLLLWKNWLNLKRQWIWTLIECCTPVLSIAILTIYVSTWPEVKKGHGEYESFQIKTAIHAFQNCHKFVFIPDIKIVNDLMESVINDIPNAGDYKFEAQISTDSLKVLNQSEICAAVVFNFKTADLLSPLENFPSVIDFSIRMSAVHKKEDTRKTAGSFLSRGAQWDTHHTFPSEFITGPRNENSETGGSPGYYTQGFLYLQNLVSEQIIRKIYVDGHAKYSNKEDAEKTYSRLQKNMLVRLQRFPYPSYKDSTVIAMIHDDLPLTIVISYLIPVMLMVWGSVVERQSGIRIQMKSYGIPLPYHRIAWFIRCMSLHTPGVAIVTAILATNWTHKKDAILTQTEPWLFFFMMMAYLWQTVCTSILLVTFFRRASTATASAGFFWFATYVPYYYVKSNFNNFPFAERLVASLLGNTAVSMGCHLIAEGEATGVGVQWDNWFRVGENWNTFTIGWVIVALLLNGILEVILSIYIGRVYPDFGITPLPWNYFLKVWFWTNQLPPDERKYSKQVVHLNSQSLEERFPENYEPESSKKRKELHVDKVTKYNGSDRVLNKVSMSCLEGQLTAVIGEPGSGKSIFLSIVSGLIPKTDGSIIVSRENIDKDVEVAKAFIGFCPTKNLLYTSLTVQETMHLYVQLKGLKNRLKEWDEVERFLTEGMLIDYRDSLVSDLTPSAKRMLMIACAFIGGSRVILLDEPTAQMSAAQKRMVWDFISKQKRHRTVLVGMESINEADHCIDQIVVLQHGEVSCRGSPTFLQKIYGGGYHLYIDKEETCDVQKIIELVSRRVQGSTVDITESQLNFSLPHENSSAFPGLFEELEKKEKILGIKSLKGSFVTMDEVFHNIKRIAMETDYDPENRKAIYQGCTEVEVDEDYQKISCCSHWALQFEHLLLKNFRFLMRRKTAFFATTMIPLLFVTVCSLILVLDPFNEDPMPLKMDFNNHKDAQVLIDCFDATNEGKFLCIHLRRVVNTTFSPKNITDLSHRRKQTITEEILEDFNKRIKMKTKTEVEIPLLGLQIAANPYEASNVEFTGFFNNQPLHVPPIVLSIIDNALLDYMVGVLKALYPQYVKDRGDIDHSIQVTNHPLPFTPSDHITFTSIFFSPGFFLGVATTLGYSFLVASFVIMHVREQSFKHLQMIAGANSFLFWATNYLWNFFHFSIVASLNCLIVWALGVPGFEREEIKLMFILLECYGCCIVFFIGAWSIIPVSHWGLAFSRTFLLLVLTGPMFMMLIIAICDPTAHAPLETVSIFHNIFLCFPSYGLGLGIYYILANSVHHRECGSVEGYPESCPKNIFLNPFNEFSEGSANGVLYSCCFNRKDNDFDFIAYGIGRNVLCMMIVLIISLIIRILKESFIWTKIKKCWLEWQQKRWKQAVGYEHEIYDYDVLNETLRVFHGGEANDLIVYNLRKETPDSIKVDNLCVEVNKGDCFCLLGVSSAGKSSALKMMAGCQMPNSGDVKVHGVSLMHDYKKYIRQLGYCPEDIPFLPELTGHEILNLIGVMRRIPQEQLDAFITNLSLRLLFLHDLETQIKNYSNVSARKLAAAVAMLGNPEVVLFDEPTNGIDLVSREYLFKSINNLTSKGSIVIVSSHSVAECEVVCSKMAIMVNGKLRCYGTPKHLRDLFAEGFTIIAKFALDPKKIYFTTKRDRGRVHERKISAEATTPPEITHSKRYHEDDDMSITSVSDIHRGSRQHEIQMYFEEDEDEPVLTTWEEDLLPFVSFFERNFPDAILVDKQPGLIHYHVRHGHTNASTLFTRMEEAKVLAEVESYYVGQTNLDQVFINFTRGQRPYQNNVL